MIKRIRAVDSHTGGEPTRLVIDGFPDLGNGSMDERRRLFVENFDDLRNAIVCEPRGHDAIVGALLCEPVDPKNACGVIFFNNTGYLEMCGHGTIGLIRTLEYLGQISPGIHRVETPVGVVDAALSKDGAVSITNVPSFRYKTAVSVEVPGFGPVSGDIAYGGNWFFLAARSDIPLEPARIYELLTYSTAIRQALTAHNITGIDGAEIDHIELFGPSTVADSKNFVLCPGLEYDRSPCGTGTSAKMACRYADGKLLPGQVWRQESIIGTVFDGTVAIEGDLVIPTITGTASVTAEIDLIFDDHDPFRRGIAK